MTSQPLRNVWRAFVTGPRSGPNADKGQQTVFVEAWDRATARAAVTAIGRGIYGASQDEWGEEGDGFYNLEPYAELSDDDAGSLGVLKLFATGHSYRDDQMVVVSWAESPVFAVLPGTAAILADVWRHIPESSDVPFLPKAWKRVKQSTFDDALHWAVSDASIYATREELEALLGKPDARIGTKRGTHWAIRWPDRRIARVYSTGVGRSAYGWRVAATDATAFGRLQWLVSDHRDAMRRLHGAVPTFNEQEATA